MWLTEAHVFHQRKPGISMQIIMSGMNTPWNATGQVDFHSYPQNDTQTRVAVNWPMQYRRLTFGTNTASADAFDISRVRLIYDVNSPPADWREY